MIVQCFNISLSLFQEKKKEKDVRMVKDGYYKKCIYQVKLRFLSTQEHCTYKEIIFC